MSQFRLVLHTKKHHWGDVEMLEKYYLLQELVGHKWSTCPVVMYDTLSRSETVEIEKVLTRTGAYAPTATCRHGVHPYDCTQGCDPYALPT